jgi:hypothetical protein
MRHPKKQKDAKGHGDWRPRCAFILLLGFNAQVRQVIHELQNFDHMGIETLLNAKGVQPNHPFVLTLTSMSGFAATQIDIFTGRHQEPPYIGERKRATLPNR